MITIPRTLAAALSLLASLAPHAWAQRGAHAAMAARPSVQRSNSPASGVRLGRGGNSSPLRRAHSRYPFGYPFFGDGLTLDDLYASGYPVSSPPPDFVQFAPDMGPGNFAVRPAGDREGPLIQPESNQPLMIELQGDKYVRVTNAAASGEGLPLNFAQRPSATASALQQVNLPPAVLVFRDGRREEVRDYTIADGVLYARGDFYTDGYWSKKIDLGALNVAGTLEANANRNVKFVLPSSPNEVITRF
jgi:hypothetical protein